jgi:hypothetical protein
MSGDLEFRCRYPMGNTNALDKIKDFLKEHRTE